MTGAGGTSPFAALQEAMTDAPSAVSGGGGGGPAPSSGSDYKLSRVETNQRALIDKILARYATQNAVFRELLQNSNDAGAKTAEIRYTTDVAATAAASTRQIATKIRSAIYWIWRPTTAQRQRQRRKREG